MRATLRYEWLRLFSLRSTWWLLALGVVVSAVGTAAYSGVVWMLSEDGTVVTDVERLMATVTKPSTAPVIGGILGVLSVAGDRHHRLLGTALLREPRRARVLVAKALTTSSTAVVLGLVTVAVNAALSRLLIGAGPGRPVGLAEIALAAGGLTLACVGWCTVGLAIGVLVRSQLAAVALLLVLPFGVERSFSAMSVVTDTTWLSWVSDHLPFRSADILQAPLTIPSPIMMGHRSDFTTALGVFTFFCLVASVAALIVFRKADIHPE